MKNKPNVNHCLIQYRYTTKRYCGVARPLTKCFGGHCKQRWLKTIYNQFIVEKILFVWYSVIIKLRQILFDIKPAVIR